MDGVPVGAVPGVPVTDVAGVGLAGVKDGLLECPQADIANTEKKRTVSNRRLT
jgi:hypothetical protein